VNFSAKTIDVTQTPGIKDPRPPAKLQIPLEDVKVIVKTFKDLKEYFA
jgi:ribosome maturation protein Sdo1